MKRREFEITIQNSTSINNLQSSKKLINVIDVIGRNVNSSSNTILLYIYDDGSVEKKMIIENK